MYQNRIAIKSSIVSATICDIVTSATLLLIFFVCVCTSDSVEKSVISTFVDLIWETRIHDHHLNFHQTSLIECAKECFSRKRCRIFSFSRTLSYCELSLEAEDMTTLQQSEKSDGFITSYINTWPKYLFGKCINQNCLENESCNIQSGRCEKSALLSYNRPKDCQQIEHDGSGSSNSISAIVYPSHQAKKVMCELEGNWTVIQNRYDGSENFLRQWNDYKSGFGDATKEYWIGNDALYRLTSSDRYELRIELEDFEGNRRFASYGHFSIASESSQYMLSASGYTGNAGDSLSYHNRMKFSTIDRDNDVHPSIDCSKKYPGAWWYADCMWSNLNGLYVKGGHTTYANGINWPTWRGPNYSYRRCRMMIRRY